MGAVAHTKPAKCAGCSHRWDRHGPGGCTASYSAGPSGTFRCACRVPAPAAPAKPAKAKRRRVLALDPRRAPMPDRAPAWLWTRALELWIPADEPRPKGNSKRAFMVRGMPMVVPPKASARHERLLARAIRAALPEGWKPLGGAVRLDVRVDLPLPPLSLEHPTSWRARALAGDPIVGPIEEADRGNLLKMIEDAAKGPGGLFADDALILGGPADKRWSTSPGWWCLLWRPVGAT